MPIKYSLDFVGKWIAILTGIVVFLEYTKEMEDWAYVWGNPLVPGRVLLWLVIWKTFWEILGFFVIYCLYLGKFPKLKTESHQQRGSYEKRSYEQRRVVGENVQQSAGVKKRVKKKQWYEKREERWLEAEKEWGHLSLLWYGNNYCCDTSLYTVTFTSRFTNTNTTKYTRTFSTAFVTNKHPTVLLEHIKRITNYH